jgi:anti-sigma factor RsiW
MNDKKKTFYNGEWVDEIPCKEFVEWVTDYLEDKLPTHERKLFEAHLTQCSGCPHYLEQMRITIRTAGKLSEDLTELEPQARKELLDIFAHWKGEKGS